MGEIVRAARVLLVLAASLPLVVPFAVGQPAGKAVRGVVLGPDGIPLRNARVTLCSPLGSCTLVMGHSFQTASTDVQGRFSFDAPPAPMEVVVEHPEYGVAWATAESGATLRLQKPAHLSGTLSAPARVRVSLGLRPLLDEQMQAGAFRLGPLPPGAMLTVTIDSPRHRLFQRRVVLEAGEVQALDVGLDAGLALEGRVVPAQAGVQVRASQGELRESVATTDAEGRFRLTGLRAGHVCCVVLAPGEDAFIVGGRAAQSIEVRLPQ